MGDELRNRLREERANHNLTQGQLAERIGVSRKTINTVENGIFVPSTVLALRLAEALATTVERLFQLAPPGTASAESHRTSPPREP